MDERGSDGLARRLSVIRLTRATALRGLGGVALGLLSGPGLAGANGKQKPKTKPVCVCPSADPAGCHTAQIAAKKAKQKAKATCNYKGRCQRGVVAPRCRCGSGGPCRVFLTSSEHNGNLGGLAGADAICQGLAETAGLPGTYKAWLSDNTASPSTRFVPSNGPYRLVDGTTIANDWADLTTCDTTDPFACLTHRIDRDESGAEKAEYVWSGTQTNGEEMHEFTCQNWSSAAEDAFGWSGLGERSDDSWTTGTLISCYFPLALYCFQQQ